MCDLRSGLLPYIADVPGLIGMARDPFAPLGKAKDKSKLRKLIMDFLPDFRIFLQIFFLNDIFAVYIEIETGSATYSSEETPVFPPAAESASAF